MEGDSRKHDVRVWKYKSDGRRANEARVNEQAITMGSWGSTPQGTLWETVKYSLKVGSTKARKPASEPTSCPPSLLEDCSWALSSGSCGLLCTWAEHPPIARGISDATDVEVDCLQVTCRVAEGYRRYR